MTDRVNDQDNPISAPPATTFAEEAGVQDSMQFLKTITEEPVEVLIPAIGNRFEENGYSNFVAQTNKVPLCGRVNLVVGTPAGQNIMEGVPLDMDLYMLLRDRLLHILKHPVPMRFGYVEFPISASETEHSPGFEVLIISQENIIGITLEVFEVPPDGIIKALPVVVSKEGLERS